MAWRRLPWPASLVFATVSKLKPKSSPLMPVVLSVTGVTFCAVPASTALNTKVLVLKAAPAEAAPGSTLLGSVPPR
jgi:hypothetical protein